MAITTVAKTEKFLMASAKNGTDQSSKLDKEHLELVPQESEAVIFTG